MAVVTATCDVKGVTSLVGLRLVLADASPYAVVDDVRSWLLGDAGEYVPVTSVDDGVSRRLLAALRLSAVEPTSCALTLPAVTTCWSVVDASTCGPLAVVCSLLPVAIAASDAPLLRDAEDWLLLVTSACSVVSPLYTTVVNCPPLSLAAVVMTTSDVIVSLPSDVTLLSLIHI